MPTSVSCSEHLVDDEEALVIAGSIIMVIGSCQFWPFFIRSLSIPQLEFPSNTMQLLALAIVKLSIMFFYRRVNVGKIFNIFSITSRILLEINNSMDHIQILISVSPDITVASSLRTYSSKLSMKS